MLYSRYHKANHDITIVVTGNIYLGHECNKIGGKSKRETDEQIGRESKIYRRKRQKIIIITNR